MRDGYPCPNPICTQVFAANAIKGTGSLTCSRCGTVFQFRQPAAPMKPIPRPAAKKPPPRPPSAKTPPPPPVTLAPVAPVAQPVGAANSHLRVESSAEMVLPPSRRRQRGGWGKLIVGVLLFLCLSATLTYGVYYLANQLPDDDTSPKALEKLGNFSITSPAGWKPDRPLRLQMRVNLAMSQKRPRSHMALFYRDYRTRQPSDGELLDEALQKLRGYFASVQYEDPFEGQEKGRTDTLGGVPAIVMNFLARDRDEVSMSGQVYFLTRQAYAYWLFTWGPEEYLDQIQPGWTLVRDRIRFGNGRDGWKPPPRETERYVSADHNYQLNYLKGFWQKADNPKDYDPRCELALKAFEPSEDPDTGKKRTEKIAGKLATVQVLVLDNKPDIKACCDLALDHLTKKQKEIYPDLKVEPVPHPKTGKPIVATGVGGFPAGQSSRLRLILDSENDRYVALAVVNLTDSTLAVICECKGDRKDFWEQEFKAILETVRQASRSK